jgi:hypothetical protein
MISLFNNFEEGNSILCLFATAGGETTGRGRERSEVRAIETTIDSTR